MFFETHPSSSCEQTACVLKSFPSGPNETLTLQKGSNPNTNTPWYTGFSRNQDVGGESNHNPMTKLSGLESTNFPHLICTCGWGYGSAGKEDLGTSMRIWVCVPGITGVARALCLTLELLGTETGGFLELAGFKISENHYLQGRKQGRIRTGHLTPSSGLLYTQRHAYQSSHAYNTYICTHAHACQTHTHTHTLWIIELAAGTVMQFAKNHSHKKSIKAKT